MKMPKQINCISCNNKLWAKQMIKVRSKFDDELYFFCSPCFDKCKAGIEKNNTLRLVKC